MAKSEQLITTTVRLPPSIIQRIDFVIEGTGKSRADFIRDAILEYLVEAERKKRLELALKRIVDFLGKEESPTERELREMKELIEVVATNGGAR